MEGQKRILIVEGDDALRTMLFTILRHQPLDVDTATTYDEAMQHIAQCDYAVILVDLTLSSGINGPAFVQQFGAKRPDATSFIIGVTDEPGGKFAGTGVHVLFQKPFEIGSLAEAIRECARIIPPSDDIEPSCPPPESAGNPILDESRSFHLN
ncbi:MAG TPA: response regulator [Thermoanaerobaculia bacterium]|nr:response regulator [Thermoanaerobaculia bacterium]